jgi:glycosyltransferase involved in cell wall biosynthesis
MKILYVINNLNIGGATDALICILKNSTCDSRKIICKNNYLADVSNLNIEVEEGDGRLVFDTFVKAEYDLIHWFRAESALLFEELCMEIVAQKRILPIITTVCQYPRDFRLRLTPNEIKYNQCIVFIDKHAYACKFNKSILNDRKQMIYFGIHYDENLYTKYNKLSLIGENVDVKFGRGSSLNKCPKNMIAWFSKINVLQKQFCVVGVGDKPEWLNKEILKHKLETSVEIIPHLNFDEWLLKVSSFDIFLYQIPLNSYSSIDGTMQAAMLFSKPIVYYGSESPKELIEHGVSGFIANNKREFIHYATLLATDTELRLQIGQKANERLISEFNWKVTVENYKTLYQKVLSLEPTKSLLSFQYVFLYNIARIIYLIRFNLVSLFPEKKRKEFKRVILNLFRI